MSKSTYNPLAKGIAGLTALVSVLVLPGTAAAVDKPTEKAGEVTLRHCTPGAQYDLLIPEDVDGDGVPDPEGIDTEIEFICPIPVDHSGTYPAGTEGLIRDYTFVGLTPEEIERELKKFKSHRGKKWTRIPHHKADLLLQKLRKFPTRIIELEKIVGELGRELQEQGAKLDEHGRRLDSHDVSLDYLEARVDETGETVEQLREDVTDLEKKLGITWEYYAELGFGATFGDADGAGYSQSILVGVAANGEYWGARVEADGSLGQYGPLFSRTRKSSGQAPLEGADPSASLQHKDRKSEDKLDYVGEVTFTLRGGPKKVHVYGTGSVGLARITEEAMSRMPGREWRTERDSTELDADWAAGGGVGHESDLVRAELGAKHYHGLDATVLRGSVRVRIPGAGSLYVGAEAEVNPEDGNGQVKFLGGVRF